VKLIHHVRCLTQHMKCEMRELQSKCSLSSGVKDNTWKAITSPKQTFKMINLSTLYCQGLYGDSTSLNV